jgi:cytochrome c6
MKNRFLITAALFPLVLCGIFAAGSGAASEGELLFARHCQTCHAGGGNIINPQKTLHGKDLRANGMGTIDAIVKNMRKPGPAMTPFDEKTVPDSQARAIAEYILKTFQ